MAAGLSAFQAVSAGRPGATRIRELVVPSLAVYAEILIQNAHAGNAMTRGMLEFGTESQALRCECLIIPLERGNALLFAEPVGAQADLRRIAPEDQGLSCGVEAAFVAPGDIFARVNRPQVRNMPMLVFGIVQIFEPLLELDDLLGDQARAPGIVGRGLNAVPGIRCNEVTGAMYAFPRITLPPGVTDSEWCLALLEETGICVVPGSGFGQLPGTWHFRMTILPPMAQMERVVEQLGAFHVRLRRARAGPLHVSAPDLDVPGR